MVYAKEGFFPVLQKMGSSRACRVNSGTLIRTSSVRDVDQMITELLTPISVSLMCLNQAPRFLLQILIQDKLNVFGREWITSEHPYQWKKRLIMG